MSDIFLQYNKDSEYPRRGSMYHPHRLYPEYPWGETEIAQETNDAYDMVRECLRGLGMNAANIDKPDWNPLGSLIKQGDTVLIKPNWVSHQNKNPEVKDDLECLVTHPSIVRTVFDYVSIALAGTGKIIIADAPMQGTDLHALFDIAGYRELFSFIREKNKDVIIADLRKYHVQSKNGVLSKPIETSSSAGFIRVELNNASAHAINDNKVLRYKVSDYHSAETKAFHAAGHHAYEINRYALEADVIINLPKPKCHRLAGMTSAMKNFVGIVYDKASLPHRAEGDQDSSAGDAYQKHSLLKQWMYALDDKKVAAERRGRLYAARLANLAAKGCFCLSSKLSGDVYRIGGWYGNDTIWRTVTDLHRIITFADTAGRMQSKPQRKVLTIGDMIVCGEKDGPIGPSPKRLGAIMASDDAVLFDRTMCSIMGFDEENIKSLSWSVQHQTSAEGSNKAILNSNIQQYNGKALSELNFPTEWRFEPHSCWKGHIEK